MAEDDRKLHLDTRAVLLLLGCCAMWGLGQVAIKVTLTEFPPLMQAAVRSAGAAILLLLWMRHRSLPVRMNDGTLKPGLLAGLLFAVEFAALFAGMQFTSASRMVVFLYTAPFVVALGMPLIARNENLAPLQIVGLVGAFGGVVWALAEGLNGSGASAGDRQWLGDALGLAAAALWGGTTLVMRGSTLTRAAPEMTLLYQLAVSAVALALASWWLGEPWPRPTAHSLVPLAFQIVVVSFASYLLWFWLLRHYPATQVAAFTLLTPPLGLLAGVLLMGDVLTLRLVTALIAVCAGIALVNRRPPRRAAGVGAGTAAE